MSACPLTGITVKVVKKPMLERACTGLLLVGLAAALLPPAGCSRTPQQKYAIFLERGKAQLQKHGYQRAILEFRNALQMNPKSADAYYQLGLAYLESKDVRLAVTAFRRALELDPKYAPADLKLSELAAASRNPAEVQEAEKHLQRLIATSAADPEAVNTLAIAEWRLGKHDEAEKLLRQTSVQFPDNLRASANLATFKLAENDAAAAEAILKTAVEKNPNSADAYVTLGRFYVAKGRLHEAEQQFRRALDKDSKHGPGLVSLAELQWQAGHMEEATQLFKRSAALPDPRYKPLYATFLFRSGKRAQAVAEFEKLAREDPADRDARSRLIAVYEAQNRSADAQKLLDAALHKNPKDVDALIQRSAVYLRQAKYAQAQADLATVLRFQPDSTAAHYLLAKVYQKTGAVLRSREELTEALRLRPDLVMARIDLAELLITNNSAKTAIEVLNETPEVQKNDPAVLTQRNWAYLAIGNWAEARKGIDRLLQAGDNPEAFVQDGTLKLTQRSFVVARQRFEQALKMRPDDFKTLDLLVQSYRLENQLPAAVERIRAYAAERPKSGTVQFFLGQLLASTGNHEEARKAFAAAKTSNPNPNAAKIALARLDAVDGKLDDARKELATVLMNAPQDVTARLLLGNIEDRARNYPAAIEQYRKVLEGDESNVEALNNLAYRLAETDTQHYDEALKFAQKAKDLAPDAAAVEDTLGWVLYRKGLYTLAIPHLERAVASQPTGLRKYHLGIAYMKSGSQRKGYEMLASALNLDPTLAHSDLARDLPATNSLRPR